MQQKKLLLFESYPYFSGSQRISYNFCKILKTKGYHITLLLADDSFGFHKEKFGPYVDDILYIETPAILKKYGNSDSWFSPKNFPSSFFKGLIPFYGKCKKVLKNKKFDFFYFCDPRGATMLIPAIMLYKGKKIFHFHGRNKLPGVIAKLFLKASDKIICVSKDVADSLPPSAKKTVIYNGIDFTQYGQIDTHEALNDIRTILGENSDDTEKILYAGLIRPQKGVHHLVEAFGTVVKKGNGKIPHLFILGEPKTDDEKKYRETLQSYCRDEGFSEYVHWMGWKNNVLAWMKSCDVFVFPSVDREKNKFEGFGEWIVTTEGLPTVLIESSLCEIFAIASAVTGVKEIISSGANGIVYDADKSGALTDFLEEVVNKKNLFKGFPDRENFSIETFERKMLDALNN